MNTIIYLLFFSFLSWFNCLAQFSPRMLIEEEASVTRTVRTADFDNDGDVDVVAAQTDLIAWYENQDGDGAFSDAIAIQEGKGLSYNLFSADLDGDDFIDLVVSYFGDDEVGWYKNLGDGNFSTLQLIAVNLQRSSGVYASDLDGDNDLDLVLGIANGGGLYWVENLDGLGSFGPLITIDATIVQARTQVVGDIDGDGDNDILTNAVDAGEWVSWFENVDGLGSFSTQHIVEPLSLYENSLNLVDIDGDDDLDILSTKEDQLIWRENLDGLGNFGNFTIISDVFSSLFDTKAFDVDNDGDMDAVTASAMDNKIAWHENLDGLGAFGSQITIDSNFINVQMLYFGDLDGDSDIDLLSAANSSQYNHIVWYENLTILNTLEVPSMGFSLSPNPARDVLQIETTSPITQVRIFDIAGRLLLSRLGAAQQLDVAHLNSGLLLIEITTEEGSALKKVMKQ